MIEHLNKVTRASQVNGSAMTSHGIVWHVDSAGQSHNRHKMMYQAAQGNVCMPQYATLPFYTPYRELRVLWVAPHVLLYSFMLLI